MCGICGFSWEDKGLLAKMLSAMRHRGPDHSATYIDKDISLGYDRLSIIDLDKGNQPICSEEGDLVLFFNGEIYNFRELRHRLDKKHAFKTDSDSEVIIHAYEEYGMDFLSYLEGMFAIALYDTEKNKLILARDRLGIKPLYYYQKAGRLIFASEIKSILELEEIERKVDKDAMQSYLTFRYCPGNDTIFSGIKKLPPASYLIREKDRIVLDKYWHVKMEEADGSLPCYVNRFVSLYRKVVGQHLASDVPIGVLLSGGIDSSSIVAMVRQHSEDKLSTYTLGFENGFRNEFDDAKTVSELYGTDHHEYTIDSSAINLLPQIVWHLDEPVADPTAIPNYVIAKNAKSRVLINGDGADELFGGYEQYKIMKFYQRYHNLPSPLKKTLSAPLKILPEEPFFLKIRQFAKPGSSLPHAYQQLVSVFGDDEQKKLTAGKASGPGPGDKVLVKFSGDLGTTNQMLEHDIRTYLPDNMLLKYDKITMANSKEGRVPFCDSRIAEFSFTLPSEYKLNGMTDKFILRQAMKQYLPRKIVQKKKQRFLVPTDDWLREDFGPYSRNLIEDSKEVVSRYFDRPYIDRLYARSLSARFLSLNSLTRLYYSRQLWTLTNFMLWHKIFIEEDNNYISRT